MQTRSAVAEAGRPPVIDAQAAWTPPLLPACTCRAQGRNFELGDSVCLATPNGFRMAECELTQNVTNWRMSDQGCTVSHLKNDGRRSVDVCLMPGRRRG